MLLIILVGFRIFRQKVFCRIRLVLNYGLALLVSWIFTSFFALTALANPPLSQFKDFSSQFTKLWSSPTPRSVLDLQDSVYHLSDFNAQAGGTAFPIAPNLFVTNAHVMVAFIDTPKEELFLTNKNGENLFFDSLLMIDPIMDMALFTTTEEVSSFFTLSSRESLNSREKLFILAYPSGKFKIINTEFLEENPFAIRSTQGPLSVSMGGASGSPVLDERGEVVSVASNANIEKLFTQFHVAMAKIEGVFQESMMAPFLGAMMLDGVYPQIISRKSKYLKQMIQQIPYKDCSLLSFRSCFKKEYDKLVTQSIQNEDIASLVKLAWYYRHVLKYDKQADMLNQKAIDMAERNNIKSLQIPRVHFSELLDPLTFWQKFSAILNANYYMEWKILYEERLYEQKRNRIGQSINQTKDFMKQKVRSCLSLFHNQ